MSNSNMNGEKNVSGGDDAQNNDQGMFADLLVDERTRQTIIELQRRWLTEYHNSRERTLVELTQNLNHQFAADLTKYRDDLASQLRNKFKETKMEDEMKLRNEWKLECTKLMEKHKKELSAAKKKQWCWHCSNEAKLRCCWNTAYCSVVCQQHHWPTHREVCLRKKNGVASGGSVPADTPQAPSSSGHN